MDFDEDGWLIFLIVLGVSISVTMFVFILGGL